MVVERRKGRAREPLDAADDEPIVVNFHVAPHAIELQHRGDAIGLFQAYVSDVLEHRFAARERAESRENRQHVGNVAAVDAQALQFDAVVFHAHCFGRARRSSSASPSRERSR